MDLYLEWNSDLIVAPNGSLQTAVGWDQVRERILRRALTNSQQALPNGRVTAPDYLFDISYGFGVASLIGQDVTVSFIQDLTRRMTAAALQDSAVDSSVPPSLQLQEPQPQLFILTLSVTLSDGTPGQVAVQLGG